MLSKIVRDKISIQKTQSFNMLSVIVIYEFVLETKCMIPRTQEETTAHIFILLLSRNDEICVSYAFVQESLTLY